MDLHNEGPFFLGGNMKGKLALGAVALTLAAGLTIEINGPVEVKIGAVKRLSQEGAKKRYIMYQKPGQIGTFSANYLQLRAEGMKAKVIKKVKGMSALVIEIDPKELEKRKKGFSLMGVDNLIIEEDVIFKTQGSCSEQPAPPQNPPSNQIVPWGWVRINAEAGRMKNNGAGVKVCVLDTGADKNHPDLKGRIIGGKSFVDGNSDYQDDQGHGTHVAGIISAIGNGIDIIGVSNSKIYAVKVLDRDGSGYSSWIASGIMECVESGSKIINMSLGSDQPSGIISNAVRTALSRGVAIVAAAGNNGGPVGYPAALDGVIAVSASDKNDRITSFSSRGSQIDFMAPGAQVESLKLGGGIVAMSGTSMASPYVAGVLALAMANNGKLRGIDTRQPSQYQGMGRIDASLSVKPR